MRLRAGCGPVDPGSKGETPGSPGGGLHIYQRPPQASVQEVRNITYDESVGVEKPSPLQETRRLQERNVWIAEISLRPCYPMPRPSTHGAVLNGTIAALGLVYYIEVACPPYGAG